MGEVYEWQCKDYFCKMLKQNVNWMPYGYLYAFLKTLNCEFVFLLMSGCIWFVKFPLRILHVNLYLKLGCEYCAIFLLFLL